MLRLGNSTGTPVLIQHGIFNAADLWINGEPHQNLPILLLDAGYDVYLGNERGNPYAQTHIKYDKTDPRFWDFSFHESGYYDIPAMINTILKLRRLKQLVYIGYSLGTTVFFVMASTRPEYNDKILTAVLLAPVAHTPTLSELKSTTLRAAVQASAQLWVTLNSMRRYEIFPRELTTVMATRSFCGPKSKTLDLCLDMLGNIVGENRENIDRDTIGYRLSFSPAGSSAKTLYHLSQLYKTVPLYKFLQSYVVKFPVAATDVWATLGTKGGDNFTMIDLGVSGNLEKYKMKTPPAYPLEKITCPVALYWGKNDYITSERSVMKIASRLPNLLLVSAADDPMFTHADAIYGRNVHQLYNKIISLLNNVQKSHHLIK